ncbi:glutaredoxin domain-containing protein [Olsenella sp. An290]|uniref:glutaredoxin family protein n=1 Tax=Olsenella sp. An290 TaxID=1965625 RepID=UPI00194E5D3A|nr:glutaredoxin domain-containing protein [Olsenella sp. An290]
MSAMPSLRLFVMPSCPYCQRVLSFMDRSGISARDVVAVEDIAADPAARDELVRVGGKGQVPCLFIDGAPLYESADIIAYLQREL